jgi:hypothetical protein
MSRIWRVLLGVEHTVVADVLVEGSARTWRS